MTRDTTPKTTPLATALAPRRPRARRRPWASPVQTLVAACGVVPVEGVGAHFLVVDNRFGTPIYVFLELDPTAESGFPGFAVRAVTLDPPAAPTAHGMPVVAAIGRNPHQLDQFRTFVSNGAVAGAGFILIEPRYVGPTWSAYVLAFRPEGEKPAKRPSWHHRVDNARR